MRIRRRILCVLMVLGLALGLPAQAARMVSMADMDAAMAAGEMLPADECPHCDMEAGVDMAACSGPCFVLPALAPGAAPDSVALRSIPLRPHALGAVQGQAPTPESGPPKAPLII